MTTVTSCGVLDRFKREKVVFDPSDQTHRDEVAHFVLTGQWRKECPYRFTIMGSGVDINVIQRQLLEYYLHHDYIY